MVDRRWAIDWDAALAPPLAMLPDMSVFVPPAFEDIPAEALVDDAALTSRDKPLPLQVWENALLAELGKVEEERTAAFQRDSLHL